MASLSDISERLFGGRAKNSTVVEDTAPGANANKGTPDLAALRQAVGKGRNRPTKVEVAQQDAAQKAALDELFQNENWEEIAALYFEVRYALTGFEYFRLSDRQRAVLGRSMGTCMRLLLAIDPQWVALIVFSVNFGTYITDKEMAYRHFLKKIEAERIAAHGRS